MSSDLSMGPSRGCPRQLLIMAAPPNRLGYVKVETKRCILAWAFFGC
jgi:hypothetical protein